MKKKIDVSSIASSLRGESVFFPTKQGKPAPEKAGESIEQKRQEEPFLQDETRSSTPVRDVPRVLPVPLVPLERDVRPVPHKKRIMKQRHPSDIYQDQYDSLKQLADEERRQGGVGSMSAMVREALDTYIAKRKARK